MNFIKENKLIITIFLVSIILSIIYIFTNRINELFIFGTEIMDFIYGVSLSIIAAFIFYIFQVYIPEKKKRNILKKHINKIYSQFKEKTILDFLISIGMQSENIDNLITFDGFKSFFNKTYNNSQTNWYKVINEYENNPILLKELIYDLGVLEGELSFILESLQINNEELFKFIRDFKITIDNFKSLGEDKEKYEFYYKSFWRFLWSLYTGWDLIYGQRKSDIIKDLINKL